MNNKKFTTLAAGVAAALLVSALAFTMVSCGGDDGDDPYNGPKGEYSLPVNIDISVGSEAALKGALTSTSPSYKNILYTYTAIGSAVTEIPAGKAVLAIAGVTLSGDVELKGTYYQVNGAFATSTNKLTIKSGGKVKVLAGGSLSVTDLTKIVNDATTPVTALGTSLIDVDGGFVTLSVSPAPALTDLNSYLVSFTDGDLVSTVPATTKPKAINDALTNATTKKRVYVKATAVEDAASLTIRAGLNIELEDADVLTPVTSLTVNGGLAFAAEAITPSTIAAVSGSGTIDMSGTDVIQTNWKDYLGVKSLIVGTVTVVEADGEKIANTLTASSLTVTAGNAVTVPGNLILTAGVITGAAGSSGGVGADTSLTVSGTLHSLGTITLTGGAGHSGGVGGKATLTVADAKLLGTGTITLVGGAFGSPNAGGDAVLSVTGAKITNVDGTGSAFKKGGGTVTASTSTGGSATSTATSITRPGASS